MIYSDGNVFLGIVRHGGLFMNDEKNNKFDFINEKIPARQRDKICAAVA